VCQKLTWYALFAAAAFGFGAVHCVMSAADKYKRSQRTAAGADKWLDMRLWDDTAQCITGLQAAGYQVVVTSLQQHSVTIQVGLADPARKWQRHGVGCSCCCGAGGGGGGKCSGFHMPTCSCSTSCWVPIEWV
jgi:hypothetical protein